MTNLAAAVELVDKWCRESSEWKADKRKQLIPSHFDLGRIKALDQCAAELETILAELGRGAGGEAIRQVKTEDDGWVEINNPLFTNPLNLQTRTVYTRPPVAGLAELTDEQILELYLKMDREFNDADSCGFDYKKPVIKAAREFLGKVDG